METYVDHGREYLELHARHAPVASRGYYSSWGEDDVEQATMDAIHDFEDRFGVTIRLLGRSGRHVCIDNTPENRRRYPNLRRAAEAATNRLFASFKD